MCRGIGSEGSNVAESGVQQPSFMEREGGGDVLVLDNKVESGGEADEDVTSDPLGEAVPNEEEHKEDLTSNGIRSRLPDWRGKRKSSIANHYK